MISLQRRPRLVNFGLQTPEIHVLIIIIIINQALI